MAMQGCQQPDRPEVWANVRARDVALGQPYFWACVDQHHPGMPPAMRSRGPDHVQQFAKLSAVITPWYNESKAASADKVGTFIDSFLLRRTSTSGRARGCT